MNFSVVLGLVIVVSGAGTVLLLVELRKQRRVDAEILQAWTCSLLQRDVTSSLCQSESEPTQLWRGDASDDAIASAIVRSLRGE